MKLLNLSICRAPHTGTFVDRFASVWLTGSDGSRVRIVELWALGRRLQAFFG